MSESLADRAIVLGDLVEEGFGSAGCIVTVQIDPSYLGKQDVSTWSLGDHYEIRRGEDGSLIETITLENGTLSFPSEQDLDTRSSSTRLVANVTDVYSLN